MRYHEKKYLHRDRIARRLHPILNNIIVGNVFTVEDQIKDKLDTNAKIYNHQNCAPNSKPGKIMSNFVANAQNSTVFALVQYDFCFMDLIATIHAKCRLFSTSNITPLTKWVVERIASFQYPKS